MNKEQEVRLRYIKEILRNIIELKELSRDLIFKGGTSLMLFYNLDRFSEDLDFNYIDDSSIILIEEKFNSLGYKFINEETLYGRKFSIEYGEGIDKFHCIVDLAKYEYEVKPKINIKNFGGKPLKILTLEQNFAHKLCAFYERKKGRDIVDINFYMSKGVFPDEDILKERHNRDFKDFLLILIKELQRPYLNVSLVKTLDQLHYNDHNIVDYKKDIINNISKTYTSSKFSLDIDYKEKINAGDKIIPINNEVTLFVDGKGINNKINQKYTLVNSKKFDIIYGCNFKEKIVSYIHNTIIDESLKISKNSISKFRINI